jgi:bacillolysin/neutral peptidase B
MAGAPELVDYVVDAHSGELVAALPRTQTATWMPDEQTEDDAQGRRRRIRMQHDGTGNRRLSDTVRNVQTHDFNYRDAAVQRTLLPGELAANPPLPWSGAAISAHANATEVAEFLVTVLRRDGLDNMGGPFISSINCTFLNNNPSQREWRNAAWIGIQMIYGQREVAGQLQSYALAKDVVAHEIIHGLTDNTARLVYERESGALNESYSDIFGIIISNADQPDVEQWNWEMGEDLNVTGVPLRDLSDPTKRGQPAHMDDFRRLRTNEAPSQERNDSGWVHHNSGIHNKAAYNLITAKKADGSLVFTMQEVAALFYLALTQFLSRTSGFSDSRRGVELAAQTLFRRDPDETRDRKLAAIAKAFDDVGISR